MYGSLLPKRIVTLQHMFCTPNYEKKMKITCVYGFTLKFIKNQKIVLDISLILFHKIFELYLKINRLGNYSTLLQFYNTFFAILLYNVSIVILYITFYSVNVLSNHKHF